MVPEVDPYAEFSRLAKQLEERCKIAKLSFVCELEPGEQPYARVEMPNGRKTRRLSFFDSASIQAILDVPFANYTFLGDYVAVASYHTSEIEAIVEVVSPFRLSVEAVLNFDKGVSTKLIQVAASADPSAPRITIGECSRDLAGLLEGSRIYSVKRLWSIRIAGIPVSRHDDALRLLERLSNSLFFQLDMSQNKLLQLRRERDPRLTGLWGSKKDLDLHFPQVEYDQPPMVLYRYARSARGMPLLQFLAYYQCIEYYFPTYAESEVRRRLRNILKDPTFREDRDADLGRLVAILTVKGRGALDERAMLRATVRECIGDPELRDFFSQSDGREKFFSGKAEGLTDKKISLNSKDVDLRDEVANRIYDIRCKIVHTKSGIGEDSIELLLPFSPGANLLDQDNALMRFIAQKVLIAGSSGLVL